MQQGREFAGEDLDGLGRAILDAARTAGLGVTMTRGEQPESQPGDKVESRRIYVNEAAAKILGYRIDELVGTDTKITFAPEETERMSELNARWWRGEALPELIETVAIRKDGTRVPVEVAFCVVPLRGKPVAVAFLRDITERKATEARLFVADRMATLGALAAGVAHEINNPLGYAMLSLESLARELERLTVGTSADGPSAMLAAARDGLTRVATIVRDLRTLSSLQTEERWPVDVAAVMESAMNVAAHAMRGRARVVRHYSAVPALKTDPARLGQICVNLLLNAAQAFASGDEQTNEIRIVIGSPDPDHVMFAIEDNGPGITTDNLERVFQPFFTTKPAGEGTGLGLAICQTTIASLHGELSVESTVGKGTTFTVLLPVNGRTTAPPSTPR